MAPILSGQVADAVITNNLCHELWAEIERLVAGGHENHPLIPRLRELYFEGVHFQLSPDATTDGAAMEQWVTAAMSALQQAQLVSTAGAARVVIDAPPPESAARGVL